MTLFLCKSCGTETLAWAGTCAKCGGAEVLKVDERPPDPLLGRTIGNRYTVLRKLGAGGMGSVYEAEQKGVGNRVALKFLHTQLSQNAALARRFLHEARTYIRVAHPAAVQLHDFGQDDDGTLFISMELVEGVDLHALLVKEGPLALPEAVDIALQIADVLAHAHQLGVVHRDLKPENVMVRKGLRGHFVKVLDFGIAKLAYDGASQMTAEGAIAGTPRYMAPEQVLAQSVDGRADIYALALVVHEMLTGRPVVPEVTVPLMMQHQLQTPLPLLEPSWPQLAGTGIDAVLQKGAAKNREDRWPSMEAFAKALGGTVARVVPELGPIPTEPVLPKPAEMLPRGLPGPVPLAVVEGAPHGPTFVSPTPRPRHDSPAPPVPTLAPEGLGSPTAPPRPSDTVPAAPPRRAAAPLIFALVVLAAAGGLAALAIRSPATSADSSVAPCPQEAEMDPDLRALTSEALAARAAAVAFLAPSEAQERLRQVRAEAQKQPAEQRRCFERLQLLTLVAANDGALRTDPTLYGTRRSLSELEQDLLAQPLKHPWSAAQRRWASSSVQDQARRLAGVPSDDEYWRRRFVGLLLVCEASDEALVSLAGQRPSVCPQVEPPERP